MQRSAVLNVINSILLTLLFSTVVSAQLHDVIPSSTFYTPTSAPTVSRTRISPSPVSLTLTPSNLESNILGVQQRNPALTNTDQTSVGSDPIGKILGLLLLVMGGVWFYKNRKDVLSSIQNRR